MADERNLLGIVGMCRGAGKAVIGTPMVCEYLRKRAEKKRTAAADETPDVIVIEASDTSENTHKKISDKCAYYKAMHIRIESDCEILGKAVGKSATATVAITDRNFCRAILEKLNGKQ
jgi:ribosomal protein L7Ae-like RNA K-turn-binding protein